MESLAFLEAGPRTKLQPVYVLHGDEDFLKRQVLAALRARILSSEAEEFGYSTHAGDSAAFATVNDELGTLPFLGSHRLVVVEDADPFVTLHRAALEKYLAQPSAMNVLVLVVKTWVSTTRLAKMVPAAATITCKALPLTRLPEWCSRWAASRHGKELDAPAARLLVDLIGAEMGQLDQELAKLATYVGQAPRIEVGDVDQMVGRSREENTFKIFDAIGNGQTKEALDILDQLLEQGEDPLGILGAFSWQLRRLAQTGRLTQQGLPLSLAMDQAGVPAFPVARRSLELQLRHLGPRRLDQLYDWLLEANLGMKGGSQLPMRTLLERLVIRLAAR